MAKWKNWDEWIDHHRPALNGGSNGHELRFAELVLRKVVGLSPDSVRHEVPFKDDQGRNRRIDFVIDDGKMARPIAIEVDGRDKKGRLLTQEEHDDFVTRQNALTRDFLVLRFTNNQVKRKSEDLRKQVKMAIAKERLKSRRVSMIIAVPDLHPVEQIDTQEPPVSAPPRRMRKLLVQPSPPSGVGDTQNRPPLQGDAGADEQATPPTAPERKWKTLSQ